MYSKYSSPYPNGGFGQIDPFERKSSFDVPQATAANIPKNYRGIYFSQKKPEPRRKDTEESVIRHAAAEKRDRSFEPRENRTLASLPAPKCEPKPERCSICENKVEKECDNSHKFDLEDLLIAGLIIVLLREGANDMLPLELALLLL